MDTSHAVRAKPSAYRRTYPGNFSLTYGQVNSGNLGSLNKPDRDFLSLSKFIVPQSGLPPIVMTATINLASSSVSELWFRCTSRVTVSGIFQQKFEFYDWADQEYRQLTTLSLNQGIGNYDVQIGDSQHPLSHFIDTSNNNQVKVKVTIPDPLLPASSSWSYDIDQAIAITK
ncbi:MAG: hypothetical protein JNM34_07405 [Chthonomonadaceae bacterium]|nr:hypothetical protein [Chthonomonadaceae bacterium]